LLVQGQDENLTNKRKKNKARAQLIKVYSKKIKATMVALVVLDNIARVVLDEVGPIGVADKAPVMRCIE